MKRIILFILLITASTWCLSAQDTLGKTLETSPVHLERIRGRLYNGDNGMRMDRTSLQNTLSSEDFTLYRKARRELIAAIPLWVLSGISLTAATYWVCDLIYVEYFMVGGPRHFEDLIDMIFGGFCFGVSILEVIPALILTLDSYKKLDRVASSYNQKSYPVSLSFGPTRHGVGITLNF
jgi:hypothetical protein